MCGVIWINDGVSRMNHLETYGHRIGDVLVQIACGSPARHPEQQVAVIDEDSRLVGVSALMKQRSPRCGLVGGLVGLAIRNNPVFFVASRTDIESRHPVALMARIDR